MRPKDGFEKGAHWEKGSPQDRHLNMPCCMEIIVIPIAQPSWRTETCVYQATCTSNIKGSEISIRYHKMSSQHWNKFSIGHEELHDLIYDLYQCSQCSQCTFRYFQVL